MRFTCETPVPESASNTVPASGHFVGLAGEKHSPIDLFPQFSSNNDKFSPLTIAGNTNGSKTKSIVIRRMCVVRQKFDNIVLVNTAVCQVGANLQ